MSKKKQNKVEVLSLTDELDMIDLKIERLEKSINTINTEHATGLIEKLFHTFEKGGDWIVNTVTGSHNDLHVVSLIGRVRHLWGYLHYNFSVQNAQDRRGPNSSIQGYASDIMYMAANRLLDIVWFNFIKKGFGFSLKLRNLVHDAVYYTVKLEEFPIAAYVVTHCMTTLTSQHIRKVYGTKLLMGSETDLELGSSWGTTKSWDFSEASLVRILNEIMDEQNDIFNTKRSDKSRKRVLKKAVHNYQVVRRLWLAELEQDIAKESKNSVYCKFVADGGDPDHFGFKFA